ncbi:hypothetical protein [Deinococcus hopiensis]|uniref:Uncharacterized protein n=1 Tax=Deinococcus hopiensis KR-140 TaxID=695939 RepID=A0A1W1VIU1_9DEIO|nr:hypothetical protein [Deinococcus hopiensis]SMB93246.1 hypothetical protein SAMN00790413_01905 [Deinococcus hopiensis KR-140]
MCCEDQKPAPSPIRRGTVSSRLAGGGLLVNVDGVGPVRALDPSGRAYPQARVNLLQASGAWTVVS